MVYTVLQHRDYHNTSMALEGVPELLQKILEVFVKQWHCHHRVNADRTAGDTAWRPVGRLSEELCEP